MRFRAECTKDGAFPASGGSCQQIARRHAAAELKCSFQPVPCAGPCTVPCPGPVPCSVLLLSLLCLALVAGCSSSLSAPPPAPQSITVNLSQGSATVDVGTTLSLIATVNDTKGVTWTLSGGGALSNQTPTSVTYTGPAAPGSATVTATAVADTKKSASASVTIAALPQVTPPAQIPPVTIGQTYSLPLAVTGGTTPFTWSVAQGQLPKGLALDAKTGLISGTAQAVVHGPEVPASSEAASSTNVSATVKVADSSTPAQSATIVLNFMVNPATPPLQITTSSLASGGLNVPYSAAVTATGGTPPYTFSASGLPAGLSIDAVSGAISGTPTAAGSANVVLQVHDASSPQLMASANVTLAILSRGIVGIISQSSAGAPATAVGNLIGAGDSIALSATGRYAAFLAQPTAHLVPQTLTQQDVYFHDSCIGATNCTPTTVLASAATRGSGPEGPLDGNGPSFQPTISADGRVVGFSSQATNLTPNIAAAPIKFPEIYIHETCVVGGSNCTPLTDLIDETTAAAELNQPPAGGELFRRYDLAADGLHFVFDTSATNVTPAGNPSGGIQTYVEDLTCTVFATTSSCQPNPILIPPPISNLTFTQPKLLTQSGLLMAGPAFGQGPGGASIGGVFLTGTCVAGVPDMISCMRNSDGTLAPIAIRVPGAQSMSATGRFVAYSDADSRIPAISQIFLQETCLSDDNGGVSITCGTHTTTELSVAADGSPANDISQITNHAVSKDGRLVIFSSFASNLVQGGPASGHIDVGVFVHDTCRNGPAGCVPSTVLVSVDGSGTFIPTGGTTDAVISADGHYCAFTAVVNVNGTLRTEVVLALTGF